MNLQSIATQHRKSTARRFGALALTAAVLASAAVAGNVVTAQAATNGPIDVLLGVGSTESQRILSWYFPSSAPQKVELEKTSDLATDGSFDAEKRSISATSAANTTADDNTAAPQTGYYNAHATLLNLAENTKYSYHVGAADGTGWSATYEFSTQSFTGDFDFLFFGDPQIGSSGNTALDGAGWAATLEYATETNPDAELLVSGGDQVEKANNEAQWSAFADSSTVLKQYPWAATIGNHDVGGKAYEQHNTLPNISKDADYYPGANTATNSGGDYYYIYKDVLFIDLNSNAYADASDSAHVAYVSSVIKSVGDKAKWTVLVYHHSIYSPADHANDTDNQQRRTDFTTAFSDLGVDMVLQGHDHSYSRSYALLNGAKANPAEQPGADEVVAGPGGVIYVTANSASGSKYYDLTAPDATKGGYGPDPLDQSTGRKRHFANSVENQEHVRTFIKVGVTNDKLNVSTVRAGDCSTDQTTNPNAAVQLDKVHTCGVTAMTAVAGAPTDAAAIGSLVDTFSLSSAAPATTTTVTASKSSIVEGDKTPVTLTASVKGGLGDLTGTVRFYEGDTVLGEAALKSGTASYTFASAPSVGTHSYTAKFTSGSAFTASGSTSSAASLEVTKVPTTPTTPAPVVVPSATILKYSNGTVTLSVAATGATATGTATVYQGTKVLGEASIVNGVGSVKVSLTKAGKHTLYAVFAATPTVASSTSAPVTVTIAKSTTTLKYAKKVVSLTVKASGTKTVAGSAKVYDGSKLLKTVKIVKGKASVKVSLKKGTHKLHATFAPTGTIATSTSKTVSVKIK